MKNGGPMVRKTQKKGEGAGEPLTITLPGNPPIVGKEAQRTVIAFDLGGGRVVECYERAGGEWHMLIFNRGTLEDCLGYHRDPRVLLGELHGLLGKARIARGARALDLVSTFGAVVQDAIAMQTGSK